ncbi:hypothetical protein C0Q70_03588 [Pomacea canaliculata]|uniref:Uncharacterized protein n=1 Tax=Pomacea canaliculata TaxID=400727 RepID=A0A2T7PT46_POMCA|nr:hypothetical protein C0Q70_03588 [Pomacea canaliculata]
MTDAYPYHDRHELIQQIQRHQQERQLSSVDYNQDDDWPSSIKDADESAWEQYGDEHSPQHEERRARQRVGGKKSAGHHHPAHIPYHPDPPSRFRSHTLMTDDDKRIYTETRVDADTNRRLELIRQLNQRAEEEFKRRIEAEEDERNDGENDEEEAEEEKRKDRWDVLDNDTEDYENDNNVNTNFYARRENEKTRRKKDKSRRIRSRGSGDVRRRRQVSEPQRPHYPPGPRSEPAYSREVTPGKAPYRASSLPPLGLDDASSISNNNDDDGLTTSRTVSDDPGAFFDRYARRATRASVLTKAEELLLRRKSRPLTNISESDDEGDDAATMISQRMHAQRHAARHPRRQKNDDEFEEQDNEEEEEDNSEKENSVDEGEVTDGGRRYAGAAGRTRMYDTKAKVKERMRTLGHDGFRKNRLQQANARIQRQRQRLPYSKGLANKIFFHDLSFFFRFLFDRCSHEERPSADWRDFKRILPINTLTSFCSITGQSMLTSLPALMARLWRLRKSRDGTVKPSQASTKQQFSLKTHTNKDGVTGSISEEEAERSERAGKRRKEERLTFIPTFGKLEALRC